MRPLNFLAITSQAEALRAVASAIQARLEFVSNEIEACAEVSMLIFCQPGALRFGTLNKAAFNNASTYSAR